MMLLLLKRSSEPRPDPAILILLVTPLLLFAGDLWAAADEVAGRRIDFARDIEPLLQAKCIGCHGPDVQESHLRLDRRSSAMRGGDSGEPALIPGNSQLSHLMQLVSGADPSRQMPPDPNDRLTETELSTLRRWIDQGAEWPVPEGESADANVRTTHWAFQPVRDVVPPPESTPHGNPIDAFIRRQLQARGLRPNPEEQPQRLIRRIFLDVTGLPPAPEKVQQFAASRDPNAWKLLVEECLASPHYGERWARYWLDLVRFAETNGFETNRERPNAWPYRDYVIRSLNDDKPYDRFIREQIAGDVHGAPVATGYLVAGPYDIVRSPDISLTLMQRQNELDDMINTTGTVFMGLTLGCARCHNHKFDPIRQTDYYALQAIFTGVEHGERRVPLSEQQQRERVQTEREIQRLREHLRPFLQHDSEVRRPAVSAKFNEELLTPIPARRIRFSIRATNASQPCIDELEVFAGGRNVGLGSAGAVATSSGDLPGYEIHQLRHINDGLHGNSHSWIADQERAWVQIELPEPQQIDRIVWSRDREGRFADRVATDYRIEVSVESDQWVTVASSVDRQPLSAGPPPEPIYDFTKASASEAEAGRRDYAALQQLLRKKTAVDSPTVIYAGQFREPEPTYRLFRGDPMAPRELVAPGTVTALGSLNLDSTASEQQRREALADWIASPQNPLTARVIVNRIWQFHFGRGLVATPSDFGLAGMPPTHPELLDWLANQLMQNNWSLKHIHRLILMSSTYRQSSQPSEAALEIDGTGELWWRFPPRRLEAEPIRDGILSVTGVLDDRMFGAGFSAFEVSMENVRHYFPKKEYGNEDFRRMIYMTRVRQEQESVFGIFDCPDGASSVPVRSRSTTPLQALNLFNSRFMIQQAELFSERLIRDCGSDIAVQVTRAFWLCYSRAPDAEELHDAVQFAKTSGMKNFCRALLNSNEFLFIP